MSVDQEGRQGLNACSKRTLWFGLSGTGNWVVSHVNALENESGVDSRSRVPALADESGIAPRDIKADSEVGTAALRGSGETASASRANRSVNARKNT